MTLTAPAPTQPQLQAQPDAEAGDELALKHLPVVGYLVTELMGRVPRHVSREDLAGAGVLALVRAARAYRPETGVPFGQFARIRIRGALVDELRSLDWASRRVRRGTRAVADVTDQLTAQLRRRPSDEEVAAALGLSVAELRTMRTEEHRAAVLSLDSTPVHSDVMSTLAAPREEGPEERLLRRERVAALHDAVRSLPDRQRIVIEGYDLGESTMRELAARLDVSESRVSQIRSEALGALRRAMELADTATTRPARGDRPPAPGAHRDAPGMSTVTDAIEPGRTAQPSVPAPRVRPEPPAALTVNPLTRTSETAARRHGRAQFVTFQADQFPSGPRTARVPLTITEDELS